MVMIVNMIHDHRICQIDSDKMQTDPDLGFGALRPAWANSSLFGRLGREKRGGADAARQGSRRKQGKQGDTPRILAHVRVQSV